MAERDQIAGSLIDEFLGDYDFDAAYEIRIDRPPSVVYRSPLRSDFSQPARAFSRDSPHWKSGRVAVLSRETCISGSGCRLRRSGRSAQ